MSLEKQKENKQSVREIDLGPQGLSRALVKNKEGKIIVLTTFPFEIEELADIAYNTPH